MRRMMAGLFVPVVLVVLLGATNLAAAQETFEIEGSVDGLYPGAHRTLDVAIHNPHDVTLRINDLDVVVERAGPGCPASLLTVGRLPQSTSRPARPVPVTVSLQASAPDACQAPPGHCDSMPLPSRSMPVTATTTTPTARDRPASTTTTPVSPAVAMTNLPTRAHQSRTWHCSRSCWPQWGWSCIGRRGEAGHDARDRPGPGPGVAARDVDIGDLDRRDRARRGRHEHVSGHACRDPTGRDGAASQPTTVEPLRPEAVVLHDRSGVITTARTNSASPSRDQSTPPTSALFGPAAGTTFSMDPVLSSRSRTMAPTTE